MKTKAISLEMLSPADKMALLNQLKAEEAEKEAKIKAEREDLKGLTNEAINEGFKILSGAAETLSEVKTKVMGLFNSVIELKKEVYDGTEDNYSHTFTSTDGLNRIIIGFNMTDYFDDSHTAGVDGVNRYLGGLAKDPDSTFLVEAIRDYLSRDSKGNLNAKKVVKLSRLANERGDKVLIDFVNIIINSYKPIRSKLYIIAKYRDAKDLEWKTLPLGITEAQINE